MIDVHVAHLPGENQTWWAECSRSLRDQPIVLHHLNGVPGDIRQTRYDGFARGSNEYVSFVDPDDRVLPGAFAAMQSSLTPDPTIAGAYSLSNIIGDGSGLIHPFREYTRNYLSRGFGEIHQLIVVRRAVILRIMEENWDLIPPIGYTEVMCIALVAREYDWKAVNFVGYEWRKHEVGAHRHTRVDRTRKLEAIAAVHRDIVSGIRR